MGSKGGGVVKKEGGTQGNWGGCDGGEGRVVKRGRLFFPHGVKRVGKGKGQRL